MMKRFLGITFLVSNINFSYAALTGELRNNFITSSMENCTNQFALSYKETSGKVANATMTNLGRSYCSCITNSAAKQLTNAEVIAVEQKKASILIIQKVYNNAEAECQSVLQPK